MPRGARTTRDGEATTTIRVYDGATLETMTSTVERVSAPELLRSVGLDVDGPVVYGSRIASVRPGVFVVETSEPSEKMPADHRAIRGWLERVPELRLDGQPTTAHALVARMSTFWLPDQMVLYVGRSKGSLAARLSAFNATPLGDAKPHPGGFWLKTLAGLPRLRIWWAETDAHEEYEDALLTEFMARSGGLLPFGNLQAPGGTVRAPGLTNELRDPPAKTAAAQQVDLKAAAAKERRAQSKSVTRRAPVRNAATRAAPAPTYVSEQGRADLVAELERLTTEERPEVIARVKAAREHGDLKENAEYEYARKEQSFMEGRITTLEQVLKTAIVVDDPGSETVGVGSTVVVEVDGDRETWVIVGSLEADPVAGRISNVSPVGKVLMGRRAGESVTAASPGGEVVYRIVEVS